MLSCHSPDRLESTFDDDHAVADTGLDGCCRRYVMAATVSDLIRGPKGVRGSRCCSL
jgi:hypothetical protein